MHDDSFRSLAEVIISACEGAVIALSLTFAALYAVMNLYHSHMPQDIIAFVVCMVGGMAIAITGLSALLPSKEQPTD